MRDPIMGFLVALLMPASFCRLVSFASSALEAAYAYVSGLGRWQAQSLAETSSPPISALLPVDGYYASSCFFDFFDSSSSSNSNA